MRAVTSMRYPIALAGVALAAAAASAGAPASEPDGAASATRNTLTLMGSSQDVTLGERVRLTGSLSRGGTPVAGRRITLQADPFPFGEWRTVARTRTGKRGRYAFSQKPRRNTRYRAIAATDTLTTTDALKIYADLLGRIRSFQVEGGRATVRVFFEVPRYARLPGRRVHVYLYHRDRERGRHVGDALLERGDGIRWKAAVRFDTSGITPRNYVGMCIRETEQDGWGRLRRIDRACGRRLVPKP